MLLRRREDGRDLPALVWRLPRPLLGLSSAPLGGGLGLRHWVINATVPMSYQRVDPDAHLTELARQFGLAGPGVGLLTGVDVSRVRHLSEDGIRVWATVGIGTPTWAAAPDESGTGEDTTSRGEDGGEPDHADETAAAYPVGTINIVVRAPVRLSDAALVNAVATVTEAKSQALWELGVPGTGTATDAVTLLCPPDGPVATYGGPRSTWGSRIARLVYGVVRGGVSPEELARRRSGGGTG